MNRSKNQYPTCSTVALQAEIPRFSGVLLPSQLLDQSQLVLAQLFWLQAQVQRLGETFHQRFDHLGERDYLPQDQLNEVALACSSWRNSWRRSSEGTTR